MKKVSFYLAAGFALALFACNSGPQADEGEKPKHTVKEIMVLAHKSGLMKKAILGNATAAEKRELTELYVDLQKNGVKKGSAESWKEKTAALVRAAQDVEAGKAGAGLALRKAVDCDTCHKAHK
jgi:hypothetical protein